MSNRDKDIKRYAKTSRKMEKRFGQSSKKKRLSFQSVGMLQSFEGQQNGVRIEGERAALSLRFLTSRILQVRLRPDRQFAEPFSYAIDPAFTPTSPSVTVNETAEGLSIDSHAVACHVSQSTCQLQIVLPTDRAVSVDSGLGLAWSEGVCSGHANCRQMNIVMD